MKFNTEGDEIIEVVVIARMGCKKILVFYIAQKKECTKLLSALISFEFAKGKFCTLRVMR